MDQRIELTSSNFSFPGFQFALKKENGTTTSIRLHYISQWTANYQHLQFAGRRKIMGRQHSSIDPNSKGLF